MYHIIWSTIRKIAKPTPTQFTQVIITWQYPLSSSKIEKYGKIIAYFFFLSLGVEYIHCYSLPQYGRIPYLCIHTMFVNIDLLEVKILREQTWEVYIIFPCFVDFWRVLSSICVHIWHPHFPYLSISNYNK